MAEPRAPAKSERSDVAEKRSTRGEIDTFIKTVRALGPTGSGQGRLIFAMDATMSRQPSWDLALELQADMFRAVKAVGGLDVQLVYFRGYNECQASKWVGDPDALARLMRQAALTGCRARRRTRTTRRDPTHTPASNLVERRFTVAHLDQLWVGDITYVAIAQGFVYLSVILDAWSRRVIGHALARDLEARHSVAALERAIALRRPPPGCVPSTTATASGAWRSTSISRSASMGIMRVDRAWSGIEPQFRRIAAMADRGVAFLPARQRRQRFFWLPAPGG